jgi:uncharacterized damage-inducible protein DinB
MNEPILVAVRHSIWANVELIRFCKGLSPEQRAWDAPGTYGNVERTLHHIVAADQGYLLALTGTMPAEPRANPDEPISLEDLEKKQHAVLEACEELLSRPFDVKKPVVRPRVTATAGIVLAQLVHHGSDHRAHVGSILGAHDVQPPNLDVWAYGVSIGEVTPPPR